MTYDDAYNAEPIPMVVTFLLLGTSVSFGLAVALYEFIRRKTPSRPDDIIDVTKHPSETSSSDDRHEREPIIDVGFDCKLIMSWSNVSCTYNLKRSKGKIEQTKVLHNSFGILRQGELTAIMGPSGAGKSTLLNVLAGRKSVGSLTGEITVFGKRLTNIAAAEKMLRNVTAFVPQEFAFYTTQTPEEAVTFVVQLQHGRDGIDIVQPRKLLQEVGLDDSALYTRPIGGSVAGGITIPGLSGGERKRLALACALAMKPQLLMLDEITSGLDSDMAESTISLVKDLCKARKMAAAVVVHQPNGYIFRSFDRLILLSKYGCIFSNECSRLDDLYQNGFNQPMPQSIHELPLDLLRKMKEPLCKEYVPCSEEYVDEDFLQALNLQNPASMSCLWVMQVVFVRNLRNHYVRNLTNLAARFIVYSVCAVLIGALFWQVGSEQNDGVVGALTFTLLGTYLLPFCAIPIYLHDKHFFLSERSLGLYSPWIYCVCQSILEAWVLILTSVGFGTIIIMMCSLWNPSLTDWESFFTLLSAFMVGGLSGGSVIFLVSIIMPSHDLAFLVGAGLNTTFLGVSGGFVPYPLIRDFIGWLQWISPCKYSLQALIIGYFSGSIEGEVLMDSMELNRPATITANLGLLLLLYIVFAALAIFNLAYKKNIL